MFGVGIGPLTCPIGGFENFVDFDCSLPRRTDVICSVLNREAISGRYHAIIIVYRLGPERLCDACRRQLPRSRTGFARRIYIRRTSNIQDWADSKESQSTTC